jgi:protein TonB
VFEGFIDKGDPALARRMAVSTGTALALYAAAAAGIVTLVGASVAAPAARKVQVVFRPPPPVEEAPPPPRPAPPPPAPKKLKVVEVAGLPPPAPLVAPPEIPLEKPAEAQPTGAPSAVAASSGGAGSGTSIGTVPSRPEPVHLPEAATPPRALASNPPPDYPEEARKTGREGLVILKIVIDEQGRVTVVSVMRGEEPLTSAAVEAVSRWRYEPATLGGTPISIYRILRVPFRLRT